MSKSLEVKVLELHQVDEILEYEKAKLLHLSPQEQEFNHWIAVWRKESLEHYLPLGWSFGLWEEEGHLLGYILVQSLLFFRGITQSLWVEHISFDREDVGLELVNTILGWARTQHLQKVLFAQRVQLEPLKGAWLLEKTKTGEVEILTTKRASLK